jgi:Dynein heavy chain, N-terminal region 2
MLLAQAHCNRSPMTCRYASGLQQELHDVTVLVMRQASALSGAIDCQANFMLLCAALQDTAIQQLVANQLDAVHRVGTRWRLMIIHLQEGRDRLIDATADGAPLAACSEMLATLRAIFAHFDTLCATMRNACARLRLVSDAEIIIALGRAHEPGKLTTTFLDTCFPGLVSLFAEPVERPVEHEQVVAACGSGSDVLPLVTPVAAGLVPLHQWLAQLDVALKGALRSATHACLASAPELVNGSSAERHPRQAVMLVDACVFVDAVEAALCAVADGSKPAAMRQIAEVTAVRLETLSQRIAEAVGGKSAAPAELGTCQAMLLTGQMHRDVAEQLFREGASAPSDWTWLRQIRHYWLEEARDCSICVGDVQMLYGWEYSGSRSCTSELLLIRSDRTMLAACMALRHSGALAFCPSVQKLGVPMHSLARSVAATFGRRLLSFECTPSATAAELARALQVHRLSTTECLCVALCCSGRFVQCCQSRLPVLPCAEVGCACAEHAHHGRVGLDWQH